MWRILDPCRLIQNRLVHQTHRNRMIIQRSNVVRPIVDQPLLSGMRKRRDDPKQCSWPTIAPVPNDTIRAIRLVVLRYIKFYEVAESTAPQASAMTLGHV